jgi:hypothetical protein
MAIDQDTNPYTVRVRDYRRIRDGVVEDVQLHWRRPRRWFRRPRS